MSDIAAELAKLHDLEGAEFVMQLKAIAARNEFHPLKDNPSIYATGATSNADYDNLLAAARKAVDLGYKVYILPNPSGIRTADYILERKGVYKLFELKSISGKTSANDRLIESIGQTNHVILNLLTDYNARKLAKDIKIYFEANREAREVLILKGNKMLSVSRRFVEGKDYVKMFMKRYLR